MRSTHRPVITLLAAGVVAAATACSDQNLTRPSATLSEPEAAAAQGPRIIGPNNLGSPGGNFTIAEKLNDRNWVVGYSSGPDFGMRPFLLRAGEFTILQAPAEFNVGPGPSDWSGVAYDINERGDAVGTVSATSTGDATRPVFWRVRGDPIALPLLPGGIIGQVTGINAFRQAAGASGTQPSTDFFGAQYHAVLWEDRVAHDLGTLGGPRSLAFDVNDHGVVIGIASTASSGDHPFRWIDGAMQDIGGPTGLLSASVINISGVIGGTANGPNGLQAALWREGTVQLLERDAFGLNFVADINDLDDAVGFAFTSSGDRALLWIDGQVYELPTPAGATSSRAMGINNERTIAGFFVDPNGTATAVSWVVKGLGGTLVRPGANMLSASYSITGAPVRLPRCERGLQAYRPLPSIVPPCASGELK